MEKCTPFFSAAAISVYLVLSGFAPFELLVDAVAPVEFAYKYLVGRILIALCIGALALSLTKPVMICVTALAGGTLAAVALCVALGFGGETGAVTVIGLVFSCVGALSQFRVGHHHKKKDVHNEEKTTCEDEAA